MCVCVSGDVMSSLYLHCFPHGEGPMDLIACTKWGLCEVNTICHFQWKLPELDVYISLKFISWHSPPSKFNACDLREGDLGRWVGLEDGSLVNGISTLRKKTDGSTVCFTMGGHSATLSTFRRLQIPWCLALTSPPPWSVKIEFSFLFPKFYLYCGMKALSLALIPGSDLRCPQAIRCLDILL